MQQELMHTHETLLTEPGLTLWFANHRVLHVS